MASPSSAFETLSDEILMIIMRYSGNVTSVFRTFSGLNQRFNQILVDRHLHLLTDFLHINIRQSNFNYYYTTPLFHALSQQLCSLQDNDDRERQIDQCFEKLTSFHIQEITRQIKDQFRFSREQFHSIRVNLSDEEIRFRDAALKRAFNDLQFHSLNHERLQQIENLVIGTGARLECTDNELGEYNLAKALNKLLLAHLYTIGYPSQLCLYSLHRLFKALIVSNPNLVNNKDYVGNGGSPVYFFLSHAIFTLQDFYRSSRSLPINIQKYQIVLELLLFIIQYLKQISNNKLWAKDCVSNCLRVVTSINHEVDEKMYIQYSQMEVLKMLFDEMMRQDRPSDDYWNCMLQEGLSNLIVTGRSDILHYVYYQSSFMLNFVADTRHCHKFIDTMTGIRDRRRIFQHFLDENLFEPWLRSAALLFILLKKKECKWIKKLFRADPTLVHRVDEDGNDPLLYVCLKVNGCRHRLIEYLIGIGSDLHKRNIHDDHFIQAIELKRNRKLLKQLVEHEIVARENENGTTTSVID
ncbi:unnamed protein product [Didymodactylos carnosus]|uniref:Uncharacterized protein n=1 Tax=Didymodactylos carnosus TaxID=1234261 RepID=A0A814R1V2_9BILA|nr:unnamed protein product [Didymodactylos carnosus]CAF1127165.1 unnamed protein product [Didymodactylos carnosus]CAF3579542.1 unnamed protein product [Didymodactylos carnosus]CAF3890780.1 unnamed protein product [Didymodactylos carnosus]